MTIDEALAAMARTDELHDGTEERAAIVEGLHRILIENPSEFWDTFFTVTNSLRGDDPLYALAERLIAEGRTTFADARAALEQYNAPAEHSNN